MPAPVFRFMAWLEHRRTLCSVCGEPRAEGGGDYCSQGCAEFDGEMQAHG